MLTEIIQATRQGHGPAVQRMRKGELIVKPKINGIHINSYRTGNIEIYISRYDNILHRYNGRIYRNPTEASLNRGFRALKAVQEKINAGKDTPC